MAGTASGGRCSTAREAAGGGVWAGGGDAVGVGASWGHAVGVGAGTGGGEGVGAGEAREETGPARCGWPSLRGDGDGTGDGEVWLAWSPASSSELRPSSSRGGAAGLVAGFLQRALAEQQASQPGRGRGGEELGNRAPWVDPMMWWPARSGQGHRQDVDQIGSKER